MTRVNRCKLRAVFAALCVATASLPQASSKVNEYRENLRAPSPWEVLLDFNSANGAVPEFESLQQGIDGNLYGTTHYGGSGDCYDDYYGHGCGTVFKITTQGKLTTLHSFNNTDGAYPAAGIILGTDGNFYGTTSGGGSGGAGCSSCGTVFRMSPSGTVTVLHNFGFTDGGNPYAPLVQGSDGNFYGTTVNGGAGTGCVLGAPCGTVFKITSTGEVTTLHSFNFTDGANPYAGLIQAVDGNFYGTTLNGGNASNCAKGCGTIFRMTAHGKLTTLHEFTSTDGANPHASLLQNTDKSFYGTTVAGGNTSFCTGGCGTIFKLTPQGLFTTFHKFCSGNNCPDGYWPYAGLSRGTDGNFYGTTIFGGEDGNGTAFNISPAGKLTTIQIFDINNGSVPEAGVTQSTNGLFYGTTSQGGIHDIYGTVFDVDMDVGAFAAFIRGWGKVGQLEGILGQGLTGATSVSFNGILANFRVVSDTFLKATVPAGAATGLVTVIAPSGTLTSNQPFRVTPQLLSFDPPSGPVGTSVTITGVSLTQTKGVGFGDRIPAQFTVDSDTQLTATVPSGAKTGKIGIETKGGTAISSGVFTVTH